MISVWYLIGCYLPEAYLSYIVRCSCPLCCLSLHDGPLSCHDRRQSSTDPTPTARGLGSHSSGNGSPSLARPWSIREAKQDWTVVKLSRLARVEGVQIGRPAVRSRFDRRPRKSARGGGRGLLRRQRFVQS